MLATTPSIPDARETERAQRSLTSMQTNTNVPNAPFCSSDLPLDMVRTTVVGSSLGALYANVSLRDEAERYFDRDMARAINACNTKGDSF